MCFPKFSARASAKIPWCPRYNDCRKERITTAKIVFHASSHVKHATAKPLAHGPVLCRCCSLVPPLPQTSPCLPLHSAPFKQQGGQHSLSQQKRQHSPSKQRGQRSLSQQGAGVQRGGWGSQRQWGNRGGWGLSLLVHSQPTTATRTASKLAAAGASWATAPLPRGALNALPGST